eukprot:GHVP01060787.1.p1 GENE.GHVP01060787.1~~GHVP01060787.1.p1  ORF type:complete len:124 (-),score=29.22 GHVP01060787.1:74-445(-)
MFFEKMMTKDATDLLEGIYRIKDQDHKDCLLGIIKEYKANEIWEKIELCEKKLLEESLSDTQRQILVEEKKNDYIAWSIRDKLEEMWDEFDSEFREVMKLQEDKEPLIEGFVAGRIMSLFADG